MVHTLTNPAVLPESADGTEALPHLAQLDTLRAFAVFSVMIAHYLPALNAYAEWGAMGINLFFVISGFLITGILLKCRKYIDAGQPMGFTVRQFYIRRVLRIFPLYYLVIFVSLALNFADVRQNLWWYLTYSVNYYGIVTGKWITLSHFWTLALEEQFYLAWPLLIVLAPRRALLLVPLTAIAIGPVSRALILLFHINSMSLMTTPVCLDTLGLGALLAVAQELKLRKLTRLLAIAGLWIGLPLLIILKIVGTLRLPHGRASLIIFNLAIGLFSVWLISGTVVRFKGLGGRVLEWRPLRYIGVISYGIYVYHIPMLMIGKSWGLAGEEGFKNILVALMFAMMTLSVATISWFVYERPINACKMWFPYRTAKPLGMR